MPTNRTPARRGGVLLLGAALVSGALSAVAAVAVLYVNVDRLDIVEKKRAVSKVVTTVDRNTQLNVIAQEGRWYKIEVGGKQGYVADTAVANKAGGKKGQTVPLSAVKDGAIPQLDTGAAVRGVNASAQQYASGKGLRTEGLTTMQKRREAITPAEFEKFLAEGGLDTGETAAADSADEATAMTTAAANGN